MSVCEPVNTLFKVLPRNANVSSTLGTAFTKAAESTLIQGSDAINNLLDTIFNAHKSTVAKKIQKVLLAELPSCL